MCKNDNDFDFEATYNKFYTPIANIHARLKNSVSEIPTIKERAKKIIKLSKIQCAFALMDELDTDRILPVKNIHFPFDENGITNKEFFRYIHPAYLASYFIFALFAYDLASTVKALPNEILDANYKIPVPLKIPGKENYEWYFQNAYPITLNEYNQVVNHINIYQYDRECLSLPNKGIENRFIEATVMQHEGLHDIFQENLKKQISQFLEAAMKETRNYWEMIELLKEDIGISNREIADKLYLGVNSINKYDSRIKERIQSILGYQFTSLREAIIALKARKYL